MLAKVPKTRIAKKTTLFLKERWRTNEKLSLVKFVKVRVDSFSSFNQSHHCYCRGRHWKVCAWTSTTATTTPENNDMIDWMSKIIVLHVRQVCQTTRCTHSTDWAYTPCRFPLICLFVCLFWNRFLRSYFSFQNNFEWMDHFRLYVFFSHFRQRDNLIMNFPFVFS